MTKKQRLEIENKIKEIELKVNSMLLIALGFDVSDNGYLVDQDTLQRVKLGYHFLKFNNSNETTIPLHKNDILFNPLNNRKLANSLFELFLKKEEVDDDLFVRVYFTEEVESKYVLKIILENNQGTLMSEPFRNQLYCYAECIVSMYDVNDVGMIGNLLKELEELKNEIQ